MTVIRFDDGFDKRLAEWQRRLWQGQVPQAWRENGAK